MQQLDATRSKADVYLPLADNDLRKEV